ncbi:MAG: OmpH family outer membrane protein [Paracoccaceae bacterium]|nr:OmpH family outer membrane protein [Paracoccaceae bacterium]MDH5529565.1 OmpH family outer membrane protein [Paracoccaceae bacterium]
MFGLLRAVALVAALVAATGMCLAQQSPSDIRSPILTLDQERLFLESAWGKRAKAELDVVSTELAAENRRIEAELTAEEKSLTEQRETMPMDEFRAAADAFDERVTEIRRVQDGKARDVGRILDSERQKFFQAVFPILGEVMQQRGAVVILDARAIFIAADVIDVTDELLARADEKLGAGANETTQGTDSMPPANNGTNDGN